jgi:hypothetical protein
MAGFSPDAYGVAGLPYGLERSAEDIEEAAFEKSWPNYYPGERWDASDRRLALARGFSEWFKHGGGRFLEEVCDASRGSAC